MILDKLENADLYFDVVPRLREFMQFYNTNDLEDLPACRLKLQGEDLYVTIEDFEGKSESECKLESHRDYIDIQIPMGEAETMGWLSREDCQHTVREYDEGKDVEFYADKNDSMIRVPDGCFVVFFPSDAHRPGIAPGKKYRKTVVKTRVVE